MRRHLAHVFLFVLAYVLLSIADLGMLSAAEPEAKDYERFAKVFYPDGLGEFWERPWVEVETGPANRTRNTQGWLLEERERHVLILDFEGEIHTLRKPAIDEQRPRLPEKDGGFVSSEDIRDANFSVLWGMTLENFDEKSDEFLKEGAPNEEDIPDNILNSIAVHRSRMKQHIVNAARYAYLAKMQGRDEHAAELYGHAKSNHHEFIRRWVAERAELDDFYWFVAEKEVAGLRNSAVFGAHRGKPRGELLQRWQRVLAIPDHSFRDEAEAMVEGYQQLLTEDGQWQEPTPEQLAKFTTKEQIDYWMYKLRDHDYGQWSDPGKCDVFFDGLIGERVESNPAEELKKLGNAAVPQLIEHMDDMRPTRCKGHWRSYWPDGHKLLRYGDCCQQIFEAITKHQIYRRRTSTGYPTYDGVAADCKAKAQAWWEEHQKNEPAK